MQILWDETEYHHHHLSVFIFNVHVIRQQRALLENKVAKWVSCAGHDKQTKVLQLNDVQILLLIFYCTFQMFIARAP